MGYYSLHGKGDKSIQVIFTPPTIYHGVITNFSLHQNIVNATTYNHKLFLKHSDNTRELIGLLTTSYAENVKYFDFLKGKIIPSGTALEIQIDYDDQLTLSQPQNISIACSVYVDNGSQIDGGEIVIPHLIGQNATLGDSCTTGTRLIEFTDYAGTVTITVDTSAWVTNKDNANMRVIKWTNADRTTYQEIATLPQSTGGTFDLTISEPFYGLSIKGFSGYLESNLCCSWSQKLRTIFVNDGQQYGGGGVEAN